MTEHPIRLVVTDDLRRSRLTVFFRLLLAIPHFLWIGLLGIVVVVIAVLNWFATLFAGRSPAGLHDFLAGWIRYVTHIEAYLFLAANPYPGFFLLSSRPYPVDVEIDPPEPQRRLVTFFRVILFVPALIVSSAFSGFGGGGNRSGSYGGGGGLAGVAAVLNWFSSLARGRSPRGLRDVTAWSLGYAAQAWGYALLLTERYPYSGPELHLARAEADETEPAARLAVTDDLRRSRLTVFFRLALAAPHLVWFVLWTVLAWPAAALNWAAALILGRSPRPLARFLAAYLRYGTHFWAFLSLTGNPFPGFVGKPGSYPVDLELDPFAPQSRWVTLFRFVLAVPAWLLAFTAYGLLVTTAFLGWFASLVSGRMPEGLRNAGAYALGYAAQVHAYAFVLTGRYPYSGPSGFLELRSAR
jgi:hypothetical protein